MKKTVFFTLITLFALGMIVSFALITKVQAKEKDDGIDEEEMVDDDEEQEEDLTQKQVEERIAAYLERIGELRVKTETLTNEKTKQEVQNLLDKGEKKIILLKKSLAEEDLGDADEILTKIKIKIIREVEDLLGLTKDEEVDEELDEENFVEIVSKVEKKLAVLGERIEEWQDKIIRKENKGKNVIGVQALLDEAKKSFAEANTILQEAKEAQAAGDMATALQKLYSALSAVKIAGSLMQEMNFSQLKNKDKEGQELSVYDEVVWKAKYFIKKIGEFRSEASSLDNEQDILDVLAQAEEKINTIYETILAIGPEGDEAELEEANEALEEVKSYIREAKETMKKGEEEELSDEEQEEINSELLTRLEKKYLQFFKKYRQEKSGLSDDEKSALKDLLEEAEINLNTAQTYLDQGDYAKAEKYAQAAMVACKTGIKLVKRL